MRGGADRPGAVRSALRSRSGLVVGGLAAVLGVVWLAADLALDRIDISGWPAPAPKPAVA
jgi:hypothetical protein